MKKYGYLLNIILFFLIVFGGLIFSVKFLLSYATDVINGEEEVSIKSFEDEYAEYFTDFDITVDLFGGVQELLGKREVKNFDVIKANDGQLYMDKNSHMPTQANISRTADIYQKIQEKTEEMGGVFLFAQVPYKNPQNVPELSEYVETHIEDGFDMLLEELELRGINTLDLRKDERTKQYYRTDHHWTLEAAFAATQNIVKELQRLTGEDLYMERLELEQFTVRQYSDCFMGSDGVRVGTYYAPKDNFTLYLPNYDTDVSYCHKDAEGKTTKETQGDFWEAFIYKELLEKPVYKNKYNALLQAGFIENIIKNKLALPDDKKILLIAHSYGRPMAQYLSLVCKELRYLDPQKGRYEKNYLEYIESYQPDIVVLMYNGQINVG